MVEDDRQELWFWAGTLAHASLAERAEAAAAGGFTHVSLFPRDYTRARAAGLTDADILALHEERGVRLAALDPFARWLPWAPPASAAPERVALIGSDEGEFFAIAEALGLISMSAIEPFGVRLPTDELAARFAALCDRAAESGLRVHLEFSPFSGIPDLATALAVAERAGRPNGGVVFDTWHYLRGRRDDALLAAAAPELIMAVQVNDASAEPEGTLIEDTWKRRRLPGEGDFDLPTVLGILQAKPGVGPFGIEVLSEALWTLPPAEVGRRAGAALRRALS